MKVPSAAALLLALACLCATLPAQENVPVYKTGNDVSLPVLIPMDISNALATGCKEKSSGEAELTFLVDAAGKPHDIAFLHFIGDDLDRLALILIRANRFHPALFHGAPVTAGVSEKIKLTSCIVEETDAAGKKSTHMRLFSLPEQKFSAWRDAPAEAVFNTPNATGNVPEAEKIGGHVHPPVPVFEPEATFSPEARKNHIQGECFVSVIVNKEGLPENPTVLKPLGYGLDERALIAVMRYRFKPATKDGRPVPVHLTIAVTFRLYA